MPIEGMPFASLFMEARRVSSVQAVKKAARTACDQDAEVLRCRGVPIAIQNSETKVKMRIQS